MRGRQIVHFAPDRADRCSVTSIQACAFVKETIAHRITFYLEKVTCKHQSLFFKLFFWYGGKKFLRYFFESLSALLFIRVCRFCYCITLVIQFCPYTLL